MSPVAWDPPGKMETVGGGLLLAKAVKWITFPIPNPLTSGSIAALEQVHRQRVQAWEASLPSHSHLKLTSRADLLEVLQGLEGGSLHPRRLSLTGVGPFSQTLSKAYNALYKARAVRRRGEWRTFAKLVKSIGHAAEPEKMFIHLLADIAEEHGDQLYLDDLVRASLCLPCADQVCLLMLAGLHHHNNDGDAVAISYGERDIQHYP